MQQAGRRIEFFVGELETEFGEQFLRRGVSRIVAGEERPGAETFECVSDDGSSCLFCQPLTPELPPKMNSHLIDTVFELVGAQTAAACMAAGGNQK